MSLGNDEGSPDGIDDSDGMLLGVEEGFGDWDGRTEGVDEGASLGPSQSRFRNNDGNDNIEQYSRYKKI